jgi:hypothetical protein
MRDRKDSERSPRQIVCQSLAELIELMFEKLAYG